MGFWTSDHQALLWKKKNIRGLLCERNQEWVETEMRLGKGREGQAREYSIALKLERPK